MLFVFQYPVALQLCCSLIISSFSVNPAFWKIFITSKDIGIMQPFCLVSPIRTAQNLSFFKTRQLSAATFSISSRKSFILRCDRSSLISSLYLIISAYGGFVQIKSMLLSAMKSNFLASPLWIQTFPFAPLCSKLIFSLHLSRAISLTSTPMMLRLSNLA